MNILAMLLGIVLFPVMIMFYNLVFSFIIKILACVMPAFVGLQVTDVNLWTRFCRCLGENMVTGIIAIPIIFIVVFISTLLGIDFNANVFISRVISFLIMIVAFTYTRKLYIKRYRANKL